MITIGQQVTNKKGQNGTITKIITKSTGYVEVTLENGSKKKEMAFNLTDENGNFLKKAPAKKESAPVVLSPLEDAISKIKWVNTCQYGDRYSMGFKISGNMLFKIEDKAEELGDTFIYSVCESVFRYMRVSDKQALCLAKFVVANNIKLLED